MRVTDTERQAIALAVHSAWLRGTRVCLRRSGVDGRARGGDIDLLVERRFDVVLACGSLEASEIRLAQRPAHRPR